MLYQAGDCLMLFKWEKGPGLWQFDNPVELSNHMLNYLPQLLVAGWYHLLSIMSVILRLLDYSYSLYFYDRWSIVKCMYISFAQTKQGLGCILIHISESIPFFYMVHDQALLFLITLANSFYWVQFTSHK